MAEQITNGGMQYVPQLAAVQQIIYLDFDGETTSYNGEILSLDNVEVETSSLTEERINNIVTTLNEKYASQNVVFVTERPVDTEYSTIFIGKTAAFDQYGNFTGLAETIDEGNLNKSDNAFVTLDATAPDTQIIATISHETDHLLGTLDHGGEGLQAYAADERYDVSSGVTSTGIALGFYDRMVVSSSGVANNTTVNSKGFLYVESGGTVNSTTVNVDGFLYVYSGGTANSTTVNSSGRLYVYSGGTANSTTVNSGGSLTVYSGGTATNIIWTPCVGSVYAADGAYVSYVSNYTGVYFGSGNQLLSHTQSMTGKTVSGSMYVMAGGTANSTTVNYYGQLYVSSGGTANYTTVNVGGYLVVSSGGSAYATRVSSGGDLYVSYGGTVNYTIVNDDGALYVSSGGTANQNHVHAGGSLCVSSGGTANSTTVNSWSYLYVSSGGAANQTTVYGNFYEHSEGLFIYAGGTANCTTVKQFGNLYISSGGIHRGSLQIAEEAIVSAYSGAVIDFTVSGRNAEEDYLINDLSLISGAPTYTITVSADQAAGTYKLAQGAGNFTTSLSIGDGSIDYGSITVNGEGLVYNDITYFLNENNGDLTLSISSVAPSVFVYSSGTLTSSGTEITGATLVYGGNNSMHVSSGGTATSTTVNVGFVDVFSGGTANSTTVNSGGYLYVFSGGTANNTTVNYWGTIWVLSGGTANSTTVNSSGSLSVSSGGTATDIIWTPCVGNLYVADGAHVTYASHYTGVYFGSGNQLLSHTQSMTGKTVSGSMYVMSDGTANSTTIDRGYLYVSSGGTANSTTVNDYGELRVSSGGTANSTTVNSWSYLYVSGTANHTTVNSNGSFHVASDGRADNTTVNGGYLYVWSGGTANSTTVNTGGSLYVRGGTANSTIVNTGGDFYVSSGGTANSTTVNSSGSLSVSSGGTANSTTVNGGRLYVYDRGTANSTTVNSGGWMYVYSGGTANCTTVTTVNMFIFRGGVANYTTVSSEGCLWISSGGVANSTTVNTGGRLVISSGGVAKEVTLKAGGCLFGFSFNEDKFFAQINDFCEIAPNVTIFGNSMTVSSGGVASSITLNSGWLSISSGGVASNTTVNYGGRLTISSGGTANSTTVNSGGNLYVSSGGIHRGSLQIAEGATVSAYSGAIIDFTISDRTASDNWLINDLSLIFGAPTYTITVSADQTAGTYKLAQGAENFTRTLSIGDGSVSYGSITVNGEVFRYNGVDYQLTQVNGDLELSIGDQTPPEAPAAAADITSWTNKDVTVTVLYSEDSAVKQYRIGENGTWLNYTKEFSVTDNAVIYFRAQDAAGNESTSQFIIDYIDKTAPELSISGNAESWTNQDVVLVASADEGTIEYFNGTAWLKGNSITAAANGTYSFRVTDKAGNVTTQNVVVDKIDKIAPVLEITGNATEWTNQDVILTASANEGTIEYFNGTAWVAGNTVTATENGTYKFRVTDLAGNVTEKSVTVDKIDKTAPTLEITGNATTWTNQDVTLTVVTDDAASGVNKVEYFNGSVWQTGSSLTVSENGIYKFRVTDLAGNVVTTSVTVDKISKVAPKLEITGNAVKWTTKDVTLTATAKDSLDGTIEYFDGSQWQTGNTLTVSENGTYKFRVTDVAGNVTEQSVVVDKIDKVAPTLEITGNATTWTKQNVTLTAVTDDAASGIETIEYFNGSAWVTGNNLIVSENGTCQFRVTDAAGNMTEKSVTVDKIDKTAPTLEITGNATTWTNQDVTLTAVTDDAASGVNKVEYFNGSVWQSGSSLTVSENGIYKFRVTDLAGNVVTTSVTVDKISKVAPKLEITGNAVKWTTKDVTLTATAKDSLDGTIEYFDGSQWQTGNTLTVSENGTYLFRVTDAAGNVTEQSVVVDKIDKLAPTIEITGNPTSFTNQDVTLTAVTSDEGSGIKLVEYFGIDSWITGDTMTVSQNGTYLFRVTDNVGNVTETSVTVDKIQREATIDKPVISVDILGWTNQNVTVTADFGSEAAGKEYSYNGKTWFTYTKGIVFRVVGTIHFRGVDYAGNRTEVTSYRVNNIDVYDPNTPEMLTAATADGTTLLDWKDARDAGKAGVVGYYVRYGQGDLTGEGTFVESSRFEATSLAVGTWHYQVRSLDNAGNYSDWSDEFTFEVSPAVPTCLTGSAEGLSWEGVAGATSYTVEYSTDDFATVITLETTTCAVDSYALPEGTFKWRVRSDNGSDWAYGEEITSELSESAEVLTSDADGDMDLFFGNANGVWEAQYAAQHLGNAAWNGTREKVLLEGKNKIADSFEGSRDANILVLTDDTNGDALFVDDIYTALGDQARFSQIDEIRAGAGDDTVDMTSERYAYEGDSITIYGGAGNDTIWANNGENVLFGDAGDDRLVGGSGDDVIVGGSGNDSMHGGGGEDIFTFGADWGNDTVEQLSSGSVTLWFESGSEENWNAETLTYSDGVNTVTVSGVTEVTLKFGDEAPVAGAFLDGASEKVFEDKNNGFIA